MATRRPRAHTVLAWERTNSTTVVKGPVATVHRAISSLGIEWTWDCHFGVWVLPTLKADELFVALELAGHRVDYRDAPW